MTEAVRNYYGSFDRRELNRLETPEGRLEFQLTTRLLHPHLPATGRVLDIGGGPGRYAAWVDRRGLQVTPADPSPNLLDLARDHLAPGGVSPRSGADPAGLHARLRHGPGASTRRPARRRPHHLRRRPRPPRPHGDRAQPPRHRRASALHRSHTLLTVSPSGSAGGPLGR
ncbi:class I SAM-dependent methyltransferase [Winogradskya consettensis]|uniref:class I SAM-dependent methyltransferase n=1 Tax=Winogradskya consettensis TaxID=113560 RepID=UPI001BB3F9CA